MTEQKPWSKQRADCANCESTAAPHKAQGLCVTCYPVERARQRLKGMDRQRPETWKGVPIALREMYFEQGALSERWMRTAMKLYERRLEEIRANRRERRNVSGLSIELQLSRLAQLAGAQDPNLFHGYGTGIDHTFTPEQKDEIDRWFSRIFESRRWEGVKAGQVSRRVHEEIAQERSGSTPR